VHPRTSLFTAEAPSPLPAGCPDTSAASCTSYFVPRISHDRLSGRWPAFLHTAVVNDICVLSDRALPPLRFPLRLPNYIRSISHLPPQDTLWPILAAMVVFAAAVVATGHFICDGTTPKGETRVGLLRSVLLGTAAASAWDVIWCTSLVALAASLVAVWPPHVQQNTLSKCTSDVYAS
jgi:hypothetical protein